MSLSPFTRIFSSFDCICHWWWLLVKIDYSRIDNLDLRPIFIIIILIVDDRFIIEIFFPPTTSIVIIVNDDGEFLYEV